jgi:hypothetical protein
MISSIVTTSAARTSKSEKPALLFARFVKADADKSCGIHGAKADRQMANALCTALPKANPRSWSFS